MSSCQRVFTVSSMRRLYCISKTILQLLVIYGCFGKRNQGLEVKENDTPHAYSMRALDRLWCLWMATTLIQLPLAWGVGGTIYTRWREGWSLKHLHNNFICLDHWLWSSRNQIFPTPRRAMACFQVLHIFAQFLSHLDAREGKVYFQCCWWVNYLLIQT